MDASSEESFIVQTRLHGGRAPVRKVLHLLVLARVQQIAIHIVKVSVRRRSAVSHEESDDLSQDGEEVGELAGDEDEEGSMVARADAGVEPGAVMVVPLHALAADVAVVAPRHGKYLALIAEFIDLESLQEFHHAHIWISLDVARAAEPRHKAHQDGQT